MFGVAPPQTLYHTRAAPSSAGVLASSLASPSTPKQHRSSSYSPVSPHDTPPRNVNQSAYTRNKIKRKTHRPGTSESSEPLMNGFGEDGHPKFGFSEVYEHYRHSLNSLNDIIDRVRVMNVFIHAAGSSLIRMGFTFSRTTRPPSNASTTSYTATRMIMSRICRPSPARTSLWMNRLRPRPSVAGPCLPALP